MKKVHILSGVLSFFKIAVNEKLVLQMVIHAFVLICLIKYLLVAIMREKTLRKTKGTQKCL
jgi:hypothetical protein